MKLRIAITRRAYITSLDGINRFIFTLADGLSSLGHDVHVLSYSFRDISRSEIGAYVKSFFDSEGKVHTLTEIPEALIWPRIALTWFLKGSKLLNKLDLDAIIVNGIIPLRTEAVKIAVNHGHVDRSIFTGHIYKNIFTGKMPLQAYLQIAKYFYKHYTNVSVCLCSQLGREFKKLIGSNSVIIPLPIKLHLFKSESLHQRDSLVVHLGTRPTKNIELSIRSIEATVRKLNVNAKLIVVGAKSAYVEKLKLKYKHLIPEYLAFMLNVGDSTLRDLLAHARVLVLPSSHEAFPYSVLEAFASGLPVVVSDATPSELVSDGYNGFRVHGFDSSLYAARLASLLTNDVLWQTASRNALRTASNYSHIKIAKDYECIVRRFIETSR